MKTQVAQAGERVAGAGQVAPVRIGIKTHGALKQSDNLTGIAAINATRVTRGAGAGEIYLWKMSPWR